MIWNKSMLEDRIERIPFSGCWLWLGPIAGNGHGIASVEAGKRKGAHRVAFELYKGIVSGALNILHKCDVKSCVNPDHLYAGSQADNMTDAVERGQHFQSTRTECKFGHPYSGDNLYMRPDGRGRECKICANDRARKYMLNKHRSKLEQ